MILRVIRETSVDDAVMNSAYNNRNLPCPCAWRRHVRPRSGADEEDPRAQPLLHSEIEDTYSDALKNTNKMIAEKVSKEEGELNKWATKIRENVSNPMVMSQLVTESAPMMIGAIAGGGFAAAKLGLSAINSS